MKNRKIKKFSLGVVTIVVAPFIFFNSNALEGEPKELTLDIAKKISEGKITLEDNRVDSLLYGSDVLLPLEDADLDRLKNKFEIYVYEKNGRDYLGYNAHPKLEDTDGDGLIDSEDSKPKRWNISERDMAMFMELVYRDDEYIDKVLDETSELTDLYDSRSEYKMMNRELAPFWTRVRSYHNENGFDAVLFKTKSRFPYLTDGDVQVLAIRGTKGSADLDDDVVLSFGGNPSQADTVKNVLRELNNDPSIDNLYLTGHSLGGYLTMRALIEAHQNSYNWIKKAYTFNAPKIKQNWLKPSVASLVPIGDSLTREGRIKHYVVSNDSTVNAIGTFDGAIDIGYSERGHSSRTYFLSMLNGRYNFSIGKREDISGAGYKQDNLDELNFDNQIDLVKVYAPDIKPIIRFKNDSTELNLLNAVTNYSDISDKLDFNIKKVVGVDELSRAGSYVSIIEAISKEDGSKEEFQIPVKIFEIPSFENLETLSFVSDEQINEILKDEINRAINRIKDSLPEGTKVNFTFNGVTKNNLTEDNVLRTEVNFVYSLLGEEYNINLPISISVLYSSAETVTIEEGDLLNEEQIKDALNLRIGAKVKNIAELPLTIGKVNQDLRVNVELIYFDNENFIENLEVTIDVIQRQRKMSLVYPATLVDNEVITKQEKQEITVEEVLEKITNKPDSRLLKKPVEVIIADDRTPGRRNAIARYTYVDDSILNIEVPLEYINIPDNTEYEPIVNNKSINLSGNIPSVKTFIDNVSDLPTDTLITWKDGEPSINVNSVSTLRKVIEVRYPDSTVDEVSVDINFIDDIKPSVENQLRKLYLYNNERLSKELKIFNANDNIAIDTILLQEVDGSVSDNKGLEVNREKVSGTISAIAGEKYNKKYKITDISGNYIYSDIISLYVIDFNVSTIRKNNGEKLNKEDILSAIEVIADTSLGSSEELKSENGIFSSIEIVEDDGNTIRETMPDSNSVVKVKFVLNISEEEKIVEVPVVFKDINEPKIYVNDSILGDIDNEIILYRGEKDNLPKISVSDEEGNISSLYIENLPRGLSFDEISGPVDNKNKLEQNIKGIPALDLELGNYNINIKASDGTNISSKKIKFVLKPQKDKYSSVAKTIIQAEHIKISEEQILDSVTTDADVALVSKSLKEGVDIPDTYGKYNDEVVVELKFKDLSIKEVVVPINIIKSEANIYSPLADEVVKKAKDAFISVEDIKKNIREIPNTAIIQIKESDIPTGFTGEDGILVPVIISYEDGSQDELEILVKILESAEENTGNETGSESEIGSEKETGRGDEAGSENEAGSGNETGRGDETGSGNETGRGDEAGSEKETGSGNETGRGDEVESKNETENENEEVDINKNQVKDNYENTSGLSVSTQTYRVGIDGDWELLDADKHIWSFKLNGGKNINSFVNLMYEYNGIQRLETYHFTNGIMDSGWIKAKDGKWYYLSEVHDGFFGHLVKSWHKDLEDGNIYYLSLEDGSMLTGWNRILGEWYYFSEKENNTELTWIYNSNNKIEYKGKYGLRTLGSMYINEFTPDGSFVDRNGKKQ